MFEMVIRVIRTESMSELLYLPCLFYWWNRQILSILAIWQITTTGGDGWGLVWFCLCNSYGLLTIINGISLLESHKAFYLPGIFKWFYLQHTTLQCMSCSIMRIFVTVLSLPILIPMILFVEKFFHPLSSM